MSKPETTEDCGDCGGSGYVQRQRGAGVWEDRECPVCAGMGRHVTGQPGVPAAHQPGPECLWCGLTHGPCNGGCMLPSAVSDAPAPARDAIMRARLEVHEPPARVTAPHDTPEAVEAMIMILCGDSMLQREQKAAAMLRRLHQRAVDAERERDEARQRIHDLAVVVDNWRGLLADAKTALTTARADALREAASVCRQRLISRSYGSHADAYEYAMNAILALIKKETPDAE